VRVERAGSPVPSCLSMKSDHSMGPPLDFRGEFTSDQRDRQRVERAGSPVPSCLSMKSDHSMGPPLDFRGTFTSDQSVVKVKVLFSVKEFISSFIASAHIFDFLESIASLNVLGTVYEVPISTVEKLERGVTGYIKKWLGVPQCLSTIGLYGDCALKLPLTSLTEEFKCAKVRLQMTLNESRDAVVSNNAPTLAAGRKWRPARAVEEATTALRHADIVGHVQQGRGGLGLTSNCPAWNRATAPERRKMVVEEVGHQEEAARPASLKHILAGCKVSLTQGRYTWRHNQVLKSLASTLENKRVATNSLPLSASDPRQTTIFVREGAKVIRSSSTPLEQGQLRLACDWKMLVDVGRQLVFPPEIATTTLRPDMVLWSPSRRKVFIIELTVPWEDSVDEAYERKHLRYAELAAEAQHRGWNTEVRPVEVGCRGFVATSTTRLLRDLGVRGQSQRLAIKALSEAAERSSQWLWMKRQDPCWSLLHTLVELKRNGKFKLFQSHLNQDCPECFKTLSEEPSVLEKFMKMKESFKCHQSHDYSECSEREQEDPEVLYIVEKMLETCGSERSLKITLHILRNMKQKDLADSLEKEQHNESIKRAQQELKTHLKKKFECIFEGSATQGHSTLLNEIYTELYITEGGSEGVNNEHEVRQIEMASKRQTTQETPILCNDIFKPLPGQEKRIRTVLTKGIAGIGKTVSVQKFILDWAEGKANQDVDFMFTLPFRDLNLKKERAFSLMQLLQHYFPQLKEIQSVEGDEVNIVFIFDGLDECRLPLHFQSNEICCDITESSSVDVLLTNLIKGNLLPSALLWITSRPAATNQIPPECIHQVTEVRGFNELQKEEYFRKRIRAQSQASRIISHIQSSRSLYIMCHIPVFCWISATVLETMLGKVDSGDLPKTLTEMYTHFLLIQTNVKNLKYRGSDETNPKTSASDTEIILKLGQLAFVQLEKGNLIFYEEDLRDSGIDVSEASVYSGVCTEIFKEERGLDQEKVYCFVHLSIQEYLAALFVFHSCVHEKRNVLRAEESKPHRDRVQLSELHETAVYQALWSENGHLDLFLRFLLGLSLDSIKTLLGGLLTQTGNRSPTESRSESIEKTVHCIKTNIKSVSSAERTINLFHCLNELNDNSLVEEIQNSLRSGKLSDKKLEPHQCSALAFVLLMSEEILDEFDSQTYTTSAAGHQRLVPVVRNCRKAILNSCALTEESCKVVTSALQSSNSPLRDLDLSYNNLGDAGVKLLCAGLMGPNCKLQRLDLSNNNLGDAGVKLLCAGLMSPNCQLERLGKLQRLDLSNNNLGDAGVKLLCAGLMSPNCQLERLGLNSCALTEESCKVVTSALQSSNSSLRDLDLSYNNLGDAGVKLLCAGLMGPNCKLQRLDLSNNNLGDAGVKLLCAGLMSPNCQLERLGLGWCNLTEGCCHVLASVLCSPHSELSDLELRDNELQDSGVRALSAGLEDPHCKLQRLGLSGCRVTQRGCDSLASALCSNPSHLRELDLRYNHPGDSGVRALSAAKLDTLTLLVEHGGENRIKPGPRKYGCRLTLDPNTVHRELSLSEGNRKVPLSPPA
ncbi:NACHT, LRR and PYD domains-containing protein 3-like, partial [Conger conger]|uniref:NACHT, LRR and PYD domains-containing protein 3-like n=1 Tax=Conger conger TaxID=82655 RepID=UPI002A5AAAEE